MTASPILGIDFGTTNTSAAWFDKTGKLKLVPINEKSFMLPSVVWFPSADKSLVGHGARTQVIDDPKHTVFGAKRFLGRRFNSEFVAQHKDKFAFDIVEGPDGYCAVLIYGQAIPLTHVAELVISDITQRAARAAGHPFRECVLTVPAHATVRQREAVRVAAEKARLKVRAIINEPTAAALYYANLKAPKQTVLVFDLGGGTFDATLMSVDNRVVRVMATGGDAFLGGANFDEAIADHFVRHFEQQHGVQITNNRTVMQRLVFAAENTKIFLSKVTRADLRVPVIAQKSDGSFLDFAYTLTRKEMEDIVSRLVERSASACDDVLERAGLQPEQVDELVLVGGQTRMPAIRERLHRFKHISSDKEVNPELGVAIGAAILGRNLSSRRDVGLKDVIPMPISVMMPGGRTQELIHANTPVPCRAELSLEGLPSWEAPVPLVIFESLDSTATDREVYGTVHIGSEWRSGNQVAPTLALDMGQDFSLKAKLLAPGGMQTSLQIVDQR
ncbi:MAG: Hsp70 family protein [Archangiaceae bacterium]|nr:Hsp70 family protein [Archangiaceae bacterium]